MKKLQEELKKVQLTIDNDIYFCKYENKTKLSLRKEFIESAIESSKLEDLVIFLATNIFQDENFYKKQKVIALINAVKDLKAYVNSQERYNLNLVIRNLKSYHKIEKEEKHFILKDERMFIIQALIKVAFSGSFHHILLDMYNLKKA
ncbi:hypothetical protein CPG38_01780 [Malaciobacter marinus]|uniref:hypothetical protein n=1 Tax=Malaciobacter marinus TaxID=505249 RepID=UPI000C08C17A|nr:hypothetical protein [Malaciobacter marinus]PHO13746.1 hypothetical protein CPG38_01780 [Malaciobacter marinus]